MNILDKILKTKHVEVAVAKAARSFDAMLEEARAATRPTVSFSKALAASPTGIIAEFKRKSPSKGFIKEGADAATICAGYAEGGATALSVLTDKDYFAGSLADLRAARTAVDLTAACKAIAGGGGAQVAAIPILRKDFVVDPYQICEARIAGADAILLIAAALTPAQCGELAAFAASLGLEVLLELHNETELPWINPHVNVVGINNRDLKTFITTTEVSKQLGKLLPENMVRISESGISSPQTVRELRREGFRGFLMGENFMKQADPATALEAFIKELER